MSWGWHWFVIAGVVLSLAFFLWLLFSNRRTSGDKTTGHVWDGIEELDNPLPMWWVWMFVLSIVYTGAYLVYYPGMGRYNGMGDWSSTEQHDREVARHDARFAPLYAELARPGEDAIMQDERARQVGRRLFINHCATCHGVNGRGGFAFPNLTDDEWIWGADTASIRTTLADGRTAQMPPWEGAFGSAGVSEAVHYVLSLGGREHDRERAVRGKQRFDTFCATCHGPDGTGNPALGAPDLTDDVWLYGGAVEQIYFTVAHGRQGNMPAQAGILSEDKLDILTAYVRSLSE